MPPDELGSPETPDTKSNPYKYGLKDVRPTLKWSMFTPAHLTNGTLADCHTRTCRPRLPNCTVNSIPAVSKTLLNAFHDMTHDSEHRPMI